VKKKNTRGSYEGKDKNVTTLNILSYKSPFGKTTVITISSKLLTISA
jgi:hypothetical protein